MLCYALEYLPQNRSTLNCIGKMVLPIVLMNKFSPIIFYIHTCYADLLRRIVTPLCILRKRTDNAHAPAAKKTL